MPTSIPLSEDFFEAIIASLMECDYVIADHFLGGNDCQNLLQSLQHQHEAGQFKRAGIGRGAERVHNAEIRGDEILWLQKENPDSATSDFLTLIEGLIAYCNRTCFAGIRDYESHFAVYPPGAYYHRHLDQFRGNGNRIFTFIVYLNLGWKPNDGGILRLYIPENGQESIVDVTPTAGKLVCFKSDAIPHEVLATNAMRYSITGWWLAREKQLSFLD
jgi:SM-20-related protein